MGIRQRFSVLFLGVAGLFALAPVQVDSTECAGPAYERLRLEPISLEIDGVPIPGWQEQAREFRTRVSYWFSNSGPIFFVSGTGADYSSSDNHWEAFDVEAVPAR